MTPPRFASLAVVVFSILTIGSQALHAAPQDHLAPIPQATKEEAEVISLLELGASRAQPNGSVEIPVYNPTRYVLKGCVIRIQIPSQKINRIYSSESATIRPNTDGGFSVQTGISNPDNKEMKVELLKLTYEAVKK